jgi:hypothetical protein
MEYSGVGGKLIHEKNQKQKISWHCPFNPRSDVQQRPAIFIKHLHPKEGAWEGAEKVLSSCSIDSFSLIINIFPLPHVLFIEYATNPLFGERTLIPLFCTHLYRVRSKELCSVEQELRLHGKISSCYTLVLYLRTRGKSEKCALIAPVSLVRTVMSYWRMREGCLVTGVSPLSMRFA